MEALAFNEDEHPRDDHGRWTDGGGSEPSSGNSGSDVRPSPIGPDPKVSDVEDFSRKCRGGGEWTKDEVEAIDKYAGTDFSQVNGILRKANIDDPEWAEYKPIVEGLDRAMFRSNLPEAVTLYRGMNEKATKDLLNGLKAGDVLHDKGFTSTSLSVKAAKKFGRGEEFGLKQGGKMIIQAPKGTRVVMPGKLSGGFYAVAEQEVILSRGNRLEFVKRDGNDYHFKVVLR